MGIPGAANPLLLRRAAAVADDAYQIEKGLRFNSADSANLSRSFSSEGNRYTWTWSAWVKRNKLGTVQRIYAVHGAANSDNNWFAIAFNASDQLFLGGYTNFFRVSNQVFRDPSAWLHLCVSIDLNNSVSAEKYKAWVNGKQITSWGTSNNNSIGGINAARTHYLGVENGNNYVDLQLGDVQFIDGLSLSPAAFGELSSAGVFDPKTFALPTPNTDASSPDWSAMCSGTMANSYYNFDYIFDGSLIEDDGSDNDTAQPQNSTTATFTKSGDAITANISIELNIWRNGSSGSGITFKVNDVDRLSHLVANTGNQTSGGEWYTLKVPGTDENLKTLTKLEWSDGGGYSQRLGAIRVDGVLLRDNFTDSTTRSNPHNGTKWSDQVSGSFNGSFTADNAFDGKVGGTWCIPANGTDLTWTTSITANTQIRIWINKNGSGGTLTQNGTDLTSGLTAGDQWVNLPSKTLTTLVWGSNAAYNQIQLMAVEVDGHILIDNSVDNSFHLKFNDTSTNARLGRNSFNKGIEDSSVNGALPIYNTTAESDEYDQGQTKGSGYRDEASTAIRDALVLAIPGDSVASGTCDVHQQINTGSSNKAINSNNGSVAVKTDQSRFYGSSLYFDDSDDYINFADDADWDIGTGDYTIESWVRWETVANDETIIGCYAGNSAWQVATGGGGSGKFVGFQIRQTNGSYIDCYATDKELITDTWYHIAAVIDGNNMKFFLNGTLEKTTGFDGTVKECDQVVQIGSRVGGTSNKFNGWINDLRIYKGVAKYTSSFTPPTRNDWTVNNLIGAASNQSDVSVASAGGAKPILETSDTYGRVKSSGNRTDSVSNPYLWLPMDGSNNGTTFTDASGEGHSVTVVGNAKTVTSESKFYGSSAYFDGNGDWLDLGDHNQWISTGDFTVEFWVKFAHAPDGTHEHLIGQTGSGMGNGSWDLIRRNSSGSNAGKIQIELREGGYPSSGGYIDLLSDNQINDDLWHHIALSLDNNTARLFIDGVVQSDTDTTDGTGLNTGTALTIGAQIHSNGRFPLQGWMQDVRIYGDGKYTSTFTVPNDPNVFPASELDVLNDTPTNYEDSSGDVHGNFCTANPLQSSSSVTFSQGNLELDGDPGGWYSCCSTMAVQTGLWYWEATVGEDASGTLNCIGIGITDDTWTSSLNAGSSAGSYGYTQCNGQKRNNDSGSSYGTAAVAGDVISVAFDADNGKLWFAKNGTWFASGNPATGANAAFTSIPSKLYTPMFSFDQGNWKVNFGARSFKYTLPSGYKSLCTQNLDDFDTDNDPSKYFDVKTYDGTGNSTTNTIGGVGFQPDLIWCKKRSAASNHVLYDAIRGTSNALRSNVQNGESAFGNAVVTPTSTGFTITGSDTNGLNDSGTYVSWLWDAGTAANSSVTSCSQTVNGQWTNPTAGFSITSWEGGGGAGQTVAHGLGAKPDFFATKRVDGSQNWMVYHSALGAEYNLYLDSSDAKEDSTNAFNDTEPTPTLITYGIESRVGNSDTHITYAWTAKPGYSSFGAYDGSNSPTFIYTGFQPRWIMVKLHSETLSHGGWKIIDTARDPFNDGDVKSKLAADVDEAENGNTTIANNEGDVDILSNGFRITDNHSPWNTSGRSYVYASFAEHPFKTARAS